MLRIERAFLPVSRSRGYDAVHPIAVRHDNNQDATRVRFTQMDGALFSIPKHDAGINRFVLDYLFGLFWCDLWSTMWLMLALSQWNCIVV